MTGCVLCKGVHPLSCNGVSVLLRVALVALPYDVLLGGLSSLPATAEDAGQAMLTGGVSWSCGMGACVAWHMAWRWDHGM